MNNQQPNQQKQPGNSKRKLPKFNLTWIYAGIAIFLVATFFFDDISTPSKNVPYSTFKEYVEKDYVTKVDVVNKKTANVTIDKSDVAAIKDIFEVDSADKLPEEPHLSVEIPSTDAFDEFMAPYKQIEISYTSEKSVMSDLLWSFGPLLLLVFFWMLIMRRMGGGGAGGVFSVGKSKAKVFDKNENKINVSFKDVAGLAEAKQEVEEIVDFLKNPAKYTNLGGKIPKGALLVGPPGTGKTLLAKAVAGEAHVPFFSMSGSDFVEMFVGVGASRVRDLFRQAKEKSPCIIFIDEIDAVGRARGRNASFNSNDERENTLNQLLTEMDGFGSNSGVIILAATNRADVLDKALLRAGRFDRQILVDLPDVHERKEIFNVHLRPLKVSEELDIDFLSKQTPGFSGADIANVCNEAALIAARRNRESVSKQDFLDAVDRIIGGLEKKNKITTQSEKESIAVHEAGHAAVSWLLEFGNPLVKVTIVPRGKALGAAWYLPEERQLTTKEQMLDQMCSLLGGRASEEFVFGKVSTGALNDLERATKMAYSMVAYYGMSDDLSNLSYYDSSRADYSFTKPYSEKTAEKIDVEVQKIISAQYQRALDIISANKDGHKKLADMLVEREVIFADDVEAIFGKRQWKSRMEELSDSHDKPATAELKPVESTEPAEATDSEADTTPEESQN